MRRLTEAQRRFLRFLNGTGGSWHCSIAWITWGILQRRGLITGPVNDPRITAKGRLAIRWADLALAEQEKGRG